MPLPDRGLVVAQGEQGDVLPEGLVEVGGELDGLVDVVVDPELRDELG